MKKSFSVNKKTIKFLLLIIVLLGCYFVGKNISLDVNDYRDILSRYPLALSGVIFVLLYVFVTFFVWFGAKDVFRVASAVILGGPVSALFVTLGELGNAVVLFYFSRLLGREYIEERFHLKKNQMEEMKKQSGFWGAFILRLNPYVPFRFQDLGAGLSTMSFKQYFGAILIATPPRILFFQTIVAAVGMSFLTDTNILKEYLERNPAMALISTIYVFSSTIILLVYVVRWAGNKINTLRKTRS